MRVGLSPSGPPSARRGRATRPGLARSTAGRRTRRWLVGVGRRQEAQGVERRVEQGACRRVEAPQELEAERRALGGHEPRRGARRAGPSGAGQSGSTSGALAARCHSRSTLSGGEAAVASIRSTAAGGRRAGGAKRDEGAGLPRRRRLEVRRPRDEARTPGAPAVSSVRRRAARSTVAPVTPARSAFRPDAICRAARGAGERVAHVRDRVVEEVVDAVRDRAAGGVEQAQPAERLDDGSEVRGGRGRGRESLGRQRQEHAHLGERRRDHLRGGARCAGGPHDPALAGDAEHRGLVEHDLRGCVAGAAERQRDVRRQPPELGSRRRVGPAGAAREPSIRPADLEVHVERAAHRERRNGSAWASAPDELEPGPARHGEIGRGDGERHSQPRACAGHCARGRRRRGPWRARRGPPPPRR